MLKRIALCLVVALGIAVGIFSFVYTRPMPLEAFFPGVELENCAETSGYYTDDSKQDDRRFSITPEDPDFAPLLELLAQARFSRRLSSLLPQGTKYHAWQDGDYCWNAMLRFDDPVELPSGDTARGTLLHIDDFFGDLTVYANGDAWRVKSDDPSFRGAAAQYISKYIETER